MRACVCVCVCVCVCTCVRVLECFPHLYRGGIAVAPHGDGHGELLHKDRQGAQLAGEDKVEQRPELLQVVLHGRPRQDEPVGGPELQRKRGGRGDTDADKWMTPFVRRRRLGLCHRKASRLFVNAFTSI